MRTACTITAALDRREARRIKAEAAQVERLDRLDAKAAPHIGELCREGRTVHYVWPVGGKYREGTPGELALYLSRIGVIRA